MENQYDIFISYRRFDGWQYANTLQWWFMSKGYSVYKRADNDHGRYTIETIEAITNSSVFLLLLTPKSLDAYRDESSYLSQELLLANQLKKIIVPVAPEYYAFSSQNMEGIPSLIRETISSLMPFALCFDDRLRTQPSMFGLLEQKVIPIIGMPGSKQLYDVASVQMSQESPKTPWKKLISIIKQTGKDSLLNNYAPHKVDFDIFISYRRIDGRDHARNIQLALKAKGYKNIFFDYESIQKGEFTKRIIDAIYSCNDFILVLSPKSMKRCGKEGDPVANEIRAAKKFKKNIIPVTIDNKSIRWPRSFPKDLEFIKEIHFHDHKSDSYFDESINDLCTKLTTQLY